MGRSSQTTSSQATVPEFYENFLTQQVFPQATEIANQPFQQYGGEFTAGVSPTTQGTEALYNQMSNVGNIAGAGAGSFSNAAGAFNDLTQQTRQEQISSALYGRLGNAANMTPEDYAALSQANYNPFQEQVIDASLARAARERDIARTGEMADITRAGAFGNERRGVFEAERQAAYDIGTNQMVADLMRQGYDQAQAQTMAQLQMGQAATGAAAQGLSALGGMQRNALAQAGQGFAGIGQAQGQLAAEQEAARLAGLQSSAQGLTQLGNLEQLTNQAELDAQYNEFLREQNLPLQQLGALVSASSGAQIPQGQTSTVSSRPGFAGILGAAGAVGQGAAALGWQPFSDRRLKRNVRKIGERDGISFYCWEWNETGKKLGADAYLTQGVIAQELADIHPSLVHQDISGYLRVDYKGLEARLS